MLTKASILAVVIGLLCLTNTMAVPTVSADEPARHRAQVASITPKLVAVAARILRHSADVGVKRAGEVLLDNLWARFEYVLDPVLVRFPFLRSPRAPGSPVAKVVAQDAIRALKDPAVVSEMERRFTALDFRIKDEFDRKFAYLDSRIAVLEEQVRILQRRLPVNQDVDGRSKSAAAAELSGLGLRATPEALTAAVLRDHAEAIPLFVQAGVSPEARSVVRVPASKGTTILELTALARACYEGRTQIVHALIQSGADVNARDTFVEHVGESDWGMGGTPLMYALEKGTDADRLPIVRALIRAGANVNLMDEHRNTALTLASADKPMAARELVAAGADVNAVPSGGTTALLWAAARGHVNLVRDLLAAGANPNVVNIRKETPFSVAERADIRAMLRAAGAR